MDGIVELWEGMQFGLYWLWWLVGCGGMGDVYEVEDMVCEWIVVLKLMLEMFFSDLVFCMCMQCEVCIVGCLQELYVVLIYDFGEIDGQFYVDMCLINGVDLVVMLRCQGLLVLL